MSGGRWNYANDHVAGDIYQYLYPDYGKKGFEQAKAARRLNPLEDKMLSELVWDVFCLLHSCDWYLSCDTCEETYREDIKYFKQKWFGKKGVPLATMKAIVDEELTVQREELYKAFGIEAINNGS